VKTPMLVAAAQSWHKSNQSNTFTGADLSLNLREWDNHPADELQSFFITDKLLPDTHINN